jgi:hypothetical protein
MTEIEAKNRVIELLEKAKELTPNSLEPDLPSIEGHSDIPSWHDYEHKIWEIGEEISQISFEYKRLRKDDSINEMIVDFCTNKNAKRGRESFVMLLWYKHNQKYADQLISLLNDKYVYGHIITALNKIQMSGFDQEVLPFINDKKSWIKKEVAKYLEKFGTQN